MPFDTVFLATIHQTLLPQKPFGPSVALVTFMISPGFSLFGLNELNIGVGHGVVIAHFVRDYAPEVNFDSFDCVQHQLS